MLYGTLLGIEAQDAASRSFFGHFASILATRIARMACGCVLPPPVLKDRMSFRSL
jgi:hypothetical protein